MVKHNGISVVVPVYNSESSLQILVERLRDTLQTESDKYEVLLVNDGSGDNSWDVVEVLAKSFEFVKGINLMRNYGQHNALLAGIRIAQYDTIVTIDDDLQHPPEEIPKLLEKLTDEYDVVYGTPESRQHSLRRNVASHITRVGLRSVMQVDIVRKVSAFRAFRTRLRDAFEDYHGPFVSIDVLLTWGTSQFTAVTVEHRSRECGASNYTFRKLLVHAMDMMTGFSTFPLRVASVLGFFMAALGFGVIFYVVGRYFIAGGSVPGFPFLASIIAIFSGVQLFALGMFGEYLARMHFRIMNKPSYSIREIKQAGTPEDIANDNQADASE